MRGVRLVDPHARRQCVSPVEAARILHCHPKTVRGYIRDGLLRAETPESDSPNGRRYRISRKDLRSFIRKHCVGRG